MIAKINKRLKIYNQLKQKIKHPFLFTINFFITTRFKISLLKKVELKNGLKYNLKAPTDHILILEYVQNYYDIDNIKPGNVCVDVGANSGDFSIFISPKFKEIHAFEPIKNVFNLMNKNIQLNKLKHIKTYNFGLSEKNGKVKFELTKFTGIAKINKKGFSEINVISWSKLYKLVNKPIDLLKIDCEGAEYSLLKDHVFLKNVKEIRMEIHIFSENDKSKAEKLIELFTKQYKHKNWI